MPTKRNPRNLGPDDLVVSHFTLARHHDIEQRVRAVAAADVHALGLYIRDHIRLREAGTAPHRLVELLDEHDCCIAEIEALRGWGDPEVAAGDDYLALEAEAFAMADAYDCRYVQAIGPYAGTPGDGARAFGALCDRAADHGLLVGLEFLPFTNIADAGAALAMVEEADRPNGGVCVDIWHHTRGADDLDLIRAIPGERIMAIQMSDGPLDATLDSYYDDTLRTRVPPGDGEMDVAGFVAAVRSTGTRAPWSLEVCNAGAWETDGGDWVARSAAGLRRLL